LVQVAHQQVLHALVEFAQKVARELVLHLTVKLWKVAAAVVDATQVVKHHKEVAAVAATITMEMFQWLAVIAQVTQMNTT
jgi:hypothetical protein